MAAPQEQVIEIPTRNDEVEQDFDKEDGGQDPAPEDAIPPVPDKKPIKSHAYIVGVSCALAGLVFGYDIGGSGGTFVMDGFRDAMDWCVDPDAAVCVEKASVAGEQGWIGSLFALGAATGAVPSGWISDAVGRKWVLVAANVIFIIGAILQLATVNIAMLYSGRFTSGIGVGVLSCITGIYTSELAPAAIRGLLVSAFQLCITLGIFMAGLMNVGLREWSDGWRISYGGNILFSVILLIFLFFIDESPRWIYFKKRDEEKARQILEKYRWDEEETNYEMYLIKKDVDSNTEGQLGWFAVMFGCEHNQAWRTWLGCLIQFFQQWTGINAVMMFAPSIISDFMGDDAALWGNLAIQFSNFVATFIAIYFVDRSGRIVLLWTGGLGMGISLFAVVFLSAPYDGKDALGNFMYPFKDNDGLGWGIVVMCCVYVIFFAYSWGPLGWVICSEIHGNRARGKAVSLSTMTNWLMAFTVGKVTPELTKESGLYIWGTFLIFGLFVVVMTTFVMLCLPETANVLPEDLDMLFENWSMGKIPRDKWTPADGPKEK